MRTKLFLTLRAKSTSQEAVLLMWVHNLLAQALGCWLIWRVDRSSGG